MRTALALIVIAAGITTVASTVESDRADGALIALGLWLIVIGVILQVRRV